MEDIRFNPAGIRQMGKQVSEPLRQGAQQAQNLAAEASGIQLPKLLSDAQSHLDDVLGRLPDMISLLAGMADDFQGKMYATADNFDRNEEAASARAGTISKANQQR